MSHVTFQSDPAYVWRFHEEVGGDVAFDIGANGGMVANLYAQRFSKVVAFEPCIESYTQLVASNAPNVQPVQSAISDEVGTVEFDLTNVLGLHGELTTGKSMSRIWGPAVGRRGVQAITLDVAAAMYGQPDFIKIDTEGHEARAVAGGDIIFEARPRLFIEMHAFDNLRPILAKLQPYYRDLHVFLHDGYGRDDPLATDHFFVTAGLG